MKLNAENIAAMASRERAAFVNSLSGFKAANLVGTADSQGRTNLAIMSSAVHLGSHPPLLALVIRPGVLSRVVESVGLRAAGARPAAAARSAGD